MQLQAGVHKLVLAYNALLDELVRSFAQTHDGVEIKCWNSYAVFTELLDNAAASCIDTTTPCYTGSANDFFACSRVQNRSVNSDIDPEQHAWWDHCHPTGREIIVEKVCSDWSVQDNGWYLDA